MILDLSLFVCVCVCIELHLITLASVILPALDKAKVTAMFARKIKSNFLESPVFNLGELHVT